MFWESFPEFKKEYRSGKTQNDYSCDVRCTFVDFIESLRRSGYITEKQANNITL